ncbi:MAG: malate dehydrogenase [Planctomycetota bacterium]|nr:MAG: malate dehydrogenase [Planctomycetota bacterium]
MKVTVLGAAGGIGQPLSLLLKLGLPAGSELNLYDVNPSTPGVAVDLSHIPSAVKTNGFAADDLKKSLEGADIVVIPAGVPRKPGMTRDDLFNINAGIIHDLITAVSESCPNACVAVITNPVNTTVAIAKKVLSSAGVYNPKKLFGVTNLDVIRSKTFIGEILNEDPSNISVDVIGGHSGVTILPLLSQVKGLSLSDDEKKELINRIQNAGTEVVEAKAGAGSATLSMAQAGFGFIEALVKGLSGDPQRVCAYIDSTNDKTEFFAKPIMVGAEGVQEELSYGDLDAIEQAAFEELIPALESNIQKGNEFSK